MSTTRRDFVKSTLLAGASIALPAAAVSATGEVLPPRAEPVAAYPGGAEGFTRGIGMYPGAPAENFSPDLLPDTTGKYRNLALLRPAYHSSSYDYNLTAQLVTDGIKDTHLPTWVSVSVGRRGVLPKPDREVFFDHFPTNVLELPGAHITIDMELGGGASVPAVDAMKVFAVVPDAMTQMPLRFLISVSDDGRVYREVGRADAPEPESGANYPPDLTRGAKLLYPSIPLKETVHTRFYRVECLVEGAGATVSGLTWRVGQVEFYAGKQRVQIGGPYTFTSAWKSEGLGEEWVYVDLGTRSSFDRVTLAWIARAAEGVVQVSDDAENWRTLQPLPNHQQRSGSTT